MAREGRGWVAAEGGGGKREAFAKIALTSLSAAAAEAATFPIDAVKTRLQLQGELQMFPPRRAAAHGATSAPKNFFTVGLGVFGKEKGGILGIYRGLAPAVLRHLFYTPIRIVGYEHLRDNIGIGGESLLGRAVAGGLSGVVAQIAAEYSECPSGKKGGDLGWFPRGKMAGPFQDVAFNTPVGATSAPFKSTHGYHVILSEGRKN